VQVQQYCDVSQLEVDMCALVFMFVHPFMTFPVNYILNRWGLKLGVTWLLTQISINCVLVIIGLAIRCFVKLSFSSVVVGNTIVAVGNVFVLNAPSQFATAWFRP
jgi:hypothetical protein